MNVYLTCIFLLGGMTAGFMLPDIAQKIALYKYRKKNSILIPDSRYTTALLKVTLCILNGSVWLLAYMLSKNILVAILAACLFSTAVIITITDIRIRIVSNESLLVMATLGAAFQMAQFGFIALLTSFLCMVAMIILFTAVAGFVGLDKVGAGDVKLAGAMGLVLGYPHIILALITMSAMFLVYSFSGIILRRLTLKSMLPFAPFMMTGLAITLAYIVL